VTDGPKAPTRPGSVDGSLAGLAFAALGVVFGDIGTSPLYTLQTVLNVTGGHPSREAILGAMSLIFWTLIIVTSVKYVTLAMRIDNDGEGGILALMSLLGVKRSNRPLIVLVGLFAGLAIILAAIGTYGVISYSVSQRTSEFGLRVALGAQRLDVIRLVLLQAAKLVLAGTATGLILALTLARVLKNLIYNVSPADPLTFASVGLIVIATAVLACYIPALKATRATPMTALRAE